MSPIAKEYLSSVDFSGHYPRESRPPSFRHQHLEQEMKKQRLRFRFYRDYFGRPQIQRELRRRPFIQYKLRHLLESIRREIKECLYPKTNGPGERELNKFKHLLIIESYLERLELIKLTALRASGPTDVARLVTNS